ncbi:hypothetical protein DSM112329_01916 [Paraconexibacter sp. AEG42_29]|uniref:Uncharacterized protein n=1 Tax=Paraconexibacter sp. AEG42_29 TaxID=2997339 RepID=A0AAU7ATZ2_9ACTN
MQRNLSALGNLPIVICLVGLVLGVVVSWSLGAIVAGIGVVLGLYLAVVDHRTSTR